MRRILAAAAVAGAMFLGPAASAATVVLLTPTLGTIAFDVLAAGDDLRNNKDFSSLSEAFILDEGVNDGVQSFLLHYDRSGGLRSVGEVAGSFQFSLLPGEIFGTPVTTGLGLLATDPTGNGVTYQRGLGPLQIGVTLLRGIEPSEVRGFGDTVDIVQNSATLYTITYDLRNDGATQDEVRFFFTPGSGAPEPAAWALMISGFGLAGAALRRHRAYSVA